MRRQKVCLRSGSILQFAVVAVLTLATTRPLSAQTLLQTFTLTENFGVSHPDQIVEFALNTSIGANNSFMLGPGGQEVAYQLLNSGRIAIRTDLPANATRTWQLMSGRAPQPVANGVTVTTGTGYYEVANGLTGVRVFNPASLGGSTLAPIQGIQLRDGRW